MGGFFVGRWFSVVKWDEVRKWKGCKIVSWSDNESARLVTENLWGKATFIPLLKEILLLTPKHDLRIVTRRISSKANGLADALSRSEMGRFFELLREWSRRDSPRDLDDWMVNEWLWEKARVFGPFAVDACCDKMGANSRCFCWWSIVDSCLSKQWRGLNVYCNPPFSLLFEILTHFLSKKRVAPRTTSAVFVLPFWPTERFWLEIVVPAIDCGLFQVVEFVPEGSEVFTSPNGVRGRRKDCGPARWPVVLVRCPAQPPKGKAWLRIGRKDNVCEGKPESFNVGTVLRRKDFVVKLGTVWVRLTFSKVIQFHERSHVVAMKATGGLLRPRKAVLNCSERVPAEPESLAFLWKSRGKCVSMTHRVFVAEVKKLIQRIGLDPRGYSGHSFRRGGATVAFNLGVNHLLIKLQGDWVSNAYQRYEQLSRTRRLEMPKRLADREKELEKSVTLSSVSKPLRRMMSVMDCERSKSGWRLKEERTCVSTRYKRPSTGIRKGTQHERSGQASGEADEAGMMASRLLESMEDIRQKAEHLHTMGGQREGGTVGLPGGAQAGPSGLTRAASSVEDIRMEWDELSSPGLEGGGKAMARAARSQQLYVADGAGLMDEFVVESARVVGGKMEGSVTKHGATGGRE
eukprot:gene34407-biopygen28872